MAVSVSLRQKHWRWAACLIGALGVMGCAYSLHFWVGPFLAFIVCFISPEVASACMTSLSAASMAVTPASMMYLTLITAMVAFRLALVSPWVWRLSRRETEPAVFARHSVWRVASLVFLHHVAIWFVLALSGELVPRIYAWLEYPETVSVLDVVLWFGALAVGIVAVYATRTFTCLIRRMEVRSQPVVYVVCR